MSEQDDLERYNEELRQQYEHERAAAERDDETKEPTLLECIEIARSYVWTARITYDGSGMVSEVLCRFCSATQPHHDAGCPWLAVEKAAERERNRPSGAVNRQFHEQVVEQLRGELAEKEAELHDIRMRLRGAPDSRLDSDGGLAAATMRELERLRAEVDQANDVRQCEYNAHQRIVMRYRESETRFIGEAGELRRQVDELRAEVEQLRAECGKVDDEMTLWHAKAMDYVDQRNKLRELLREALPHVVREHDSFVQFNEEPRPEAAALIERIRKALGE